MRRPDPGQAAFDLDQLLRTVEAENAPIWDGAPLTFTTAYQTPDALDAAFGRWRDLHGGFAAIPASHMWHRGFGQDQPARYRDHEAVQFFADLRCQPDQHPPAGCACVGGLVTQVICEPCGWHAIGGGENEAVEAWHDHALPGWRSLPVLPARLARAGITSPQTGRWIRDHYPEDAAVSGAPIVTERPAHASRHVPGRSPWGGWDLAAPPPPTSPLPARTVAAADLTVHPFGAPAPAPRLPGSSYRS